MSKHTNPDDPYPLSAIGNFQTRFATDPKTAMPQPPKHDGEADQAGFAEKARLEREALAEQRRKEIAGAGLRLPQPFRVTIDSRIGLPPSPLPPPPRREPDTVKVETESEARPTGEQFAPCVQCGNPSMSRRSKCQDCHNMGKRHAMSMKRSEPATESLPKFPCACYGGKPCGNLVSQPGNRCRSCSSKARAARERLGIQKLSEADALVAPVDRIRAEVAKLNREEIALTQAQARLKQRIAAMDKLLQAAELLEKV